MSDQRLQQIVAYREETKRLELGKVAEGKFIDGLEVIQKALASRDAEKRADALALPIFAAAKKKTALRSART